MKPVGVAIAYLVLLLLMYLPPYTLLKESPPLFLYVYWVALSLIALALAPVALSKGLGRTNR